jgi:peptide/nickel transport system ATP-binding protein
MIAQQNEPLLRVRDLCKYFPVYSKGFLKKQIGVVKAADQVSFDLQPGETLGLVGESGSGKTTTARAILRAIEPTRGQVLFRCGAEAVDLASIPEQDLRPLRPRMQMIFQDPFSSLNPRLTVGAIVAEPLLIHGLAKGQELKDRVSEMLKKVGLKPEHQQRYPHAFSGGQRQRIGIARALIMHPALVVADEAVSALDVSVQAQVINLLQELQEDLGLTYLFIAHDLSVVRHLCDRVAVMYAGRIVEQAPAERLFADPRHPYTRMLLSAVPNPDPDVPMSFSVEGEVADPANLPGGCSFHPRCRECLERCKTEMPQLMMLPDGRAVACHLCSK